ncbi:MAG: hypothetical protein A2787_00965 [Omnitrophica WOR_2 bacterium RIFCSPHIGHO2_01_FULL_48_9]|nr:MAG: hypothetical protein A3D10_05805 [Omnitrophica WOR_2 bacterium RIFCSPHIGHO2_02_FULL_48_11]OGX31713.1 MAG: hypothetical protein A2787_00965 [Omnitrophica WOR_2 bacterium RIFCSPHIGHO2_01_FULL_48_9]
MKKCHNCKIVFHHPDRIRCLYCHAVLTVLSDDAPLGDAVAFLSKEDDTTVLLSNDTGSLGEVIWKKDALNPEDARYVISSYFKSRTFYFFYGLSRNELKMEKKYKRFFVHPFHFNFFLIVPWAFINVIDSVLFHLRYRQYCPTCKWKYAGKGEHDPRECAYNREYTLVINAILTGIIARIEPTFHSQAMAEIKRGQRSAYLELCTHRKYEKALDIASVCLSGGLMLYLLLAFVLPMLADFFMF